MHWHRSGPFILTYFTSSLPLQVIKSVYKNACVPFVDIQKSCQLFSELSLVKLTKPGDFPQDKHFKFHALCGIWVLLLETFFSLWKWYFEIYTVVYHPVSWSLTVKITINYEINPNPLPKAFNVMTRSAFTPLT